jgi:hypothetical protein
LPEERRGRRSHLACLRSGHASAENRGTGSRHRLTEQRLGLTDS